MLFENSDNDKKRKDNPWGSNPSMNDASSGGAFESGTEYDDAVISPEWDAMKRRTARKMDYLSTPVDVAASEKRFNDSFGNYMLPKDTPERHRKNYALSNEALDDVVGDYYNNTLKRRFEEKREDSKKKGREEYMRYASVMGADPVNAFNASMRVDDPMSVVDETMASVDDDELIKKVAPLASYGGYDAKEYVEQFVKPSLRNRMIGEYVRENTPKSSTEYIMRSALDNSLMGKIGSLGMTMERGAKNNRMLAAEGLANYDSNHIEDFLAGVGSLLVDMPVFSGLGSLSSSIVGRATTKATQKISEAVLSRYTGKLVSKEFADAVAGKVIKDRLKSRILQSATTQGLTLGGYDVANSVADDILYNGNVNIGKAVGAFAKGFSTGAAVGATGTFLNARSKGLTGGKRVLTSAGVLSAESAIFTAGTELDKLAHGVEIEPIDLINDFGESVATLLTMRMANWIPKGAMQKLNADGKIKSEFQLSASERQELREMNITPEEFVAQLEKELKMPSLNSAGARLVKEKYILLMSNKNLSASAKSKLMYLVENRVTSTPPAVFDYKADKNAKGVWIIRLLDAGGNLIERLRFNDAVSAKSNLILRRGDIRRNRIAHYERELTAGFDSQNFIYEAGRYAKENNVDVDVIAEAMYKSARNERLGNLEQKIMNDIMVRSYAYESQANESLASARERIEQFYNLEKGALSHAIDKRFIECTKAENSALDEYEAFVRSEVEKTKGRSGVPVLDGFFDSYVSNAERRFHEMEQYRRAQEDKYSGQGGTESVAREEDFSLYKVPENEPGKVWNIHGNEITVEKIKEYEKRGKELSGKFGEDVVFITDEHQIEIPEINDRRAVSDYNNRLKALGWVHKGKVYINLPNIKSFEELENTIVHEVVGHAGLKKVFGNYMYDFLEDVYKTADGTVLSGIRKVAGNYEKFDPYTVTEEYLANLVEKAYPNAQERNLLVKFKDFVRGMLVRSKIFKSKYRRVSEEDLKSILKAHTRYIINNKERNNHRKEVFNRFASAHFNEEGYYNREAYGRDKTEMAKNASYSRFVPEKLIGAKYYVNYPYYPEDVRANIMKYSGMTDKELREQSENTNYRFEGEKGAKNYSNVYPDEPGRSLEDAEYYEKSGLSPWYIKKFTGWERGADGKWRKEVAETGGLINDYIHLSLFDNNPELSELYDKIKEKPFEAWGEKEKMAWDRIINDGYKYMKNAVLEDIVTDNNFFISYPELASMPVKIVTNGASLARYDSKNKRMVVDRNLFLSPRAAAEMSGALQNVIQDYEGFSKAVSLRMLSLEGKLAKRYRKAQECIALVDGVRKNTPSFDKNKRIEKAFKREFGIDMETFKEMYPTYDDYLLHKLTGKNFSFSGNVEMDNVRKRYDMSNRERNLTLAKNTELVPRERQVVVESLDDLKRFFTGPLDVINDAVRNIHSDDPIRLRKDEERLGRLRSIPVEFAEFDESLDSYTKMLLREMVYGREKPKDPYGYEEYKAKVKARKEKIRRELFGEEPEDLN